MSSNIRVYPTCCTSAFCGQGPDSCPECNNSPVLKEFKDWKERTAARQSAPIWNPTVYEASRTEATCDYCGNPATDLSKFISGEPVLLCDSTQCHDKHTEFLENERRDLKECGLLPTL